MLFVKFICLVPLEYESITTLSSFDTTAGDPSWFSGIDRIRYPIAGILITDRVRDDRRL